MSNSTPPTAPPGPSTSPQPPQNPAQSAATGISNDAAIGLLIPVGRSPLAVAAGFLGIFSLFIIPAPIAVIVSIIAIQDIHKSQNTAKPKLGKGRAMFGLIMGILGTAVLLFIMLSIMING